MEGIFGSFGDLVPARPTEHLGNSDLSFGGKLSPPLHIGEDGGASGCGGKVWIAGELLCEYILEKSENGDGSGLLWQHHRAATDAHESQKSHVKGKTHVLELGSGTGVVGLCVALLAQQHPAEMGDVHVTVTDIGELVPLMQSNIDSNHVSSVASAESLCWGSALIQEHQHPDVVLAADCVYLEAAFPLLERTLMDLTDGDHPPLVLMAYRKRRKADRHFFQRIKHNFDVVEVSDYEHFAEYRKQRTSLFELVRREPSAPIQASAKEVVSQDAGIPLLKKQLPCTPSVSVATPISITTVV